MGNCNGFMYCLKENPGIKEPQQISSYQMQKAVKDNEDNLEVQSNNELKQLEKKDNYQANSRI